MDTWFYQLARRIWPELSQASEQRQLVGTGDVIVFLFVSPLALFGLVRLAMSTDLNILRNAWSELLVFGALLFAFERVKYFFIIEIRTDRYGSAEGSLASMLQWAAAFLFGPTALWLTVAGATFNFANHLRQPGSKAARWNQMRSYAIELASLTLAYLAGLQVYTWLGGQIPFSNFSPSGLVPALAAFAVHFAVVIALWTVYTAYAIWVQRLLTQSDAIEPILKFFVLALGLPVLAHPFAILVAGLYVQNGLLICLFFITGLLMVAYLTRQLSWAAETSRQQSRQLEKLEHLGRDLLEAPLDASSLSSLLEEHVPNMFPSGRIAIWLMPDRYLHKQPAEWTPDIEAIWAWVRETRGVSGFLANENMPWQSEQQSHPPVVLAPVLDAENGTPLGCVYIELRSLAQPWHRKALSTLYPAVSSLAAQIASSLHQAIIYAEALEYHAAVQELEFAGRIQASFLPNELPNLKGWELAVTLLPARETSGDFFDFISLQDGRFGIIIADVADKGVGAALYMALSRTLLRTYALEYEASPDIVFFSANERILADARANLFVTTFYGILDQEAGLLTYCNAGHNPPFLLSRRNGGEISGLTATGMPIGIDPDASWSQATIHIEPGDTLILYTDGIPDAQNEDGMFFLERRLVEVAQSSLGVTAQEMQTNILQAVQQFVGNSPQFDDITLLVLQRDLESEASVNVDPGAGLLGERPDPQQHRTPGD